MNKMSQPFSHLVSHKSDEYYTPSNLIESAHTLMGSIDLDPASCKEANKIVRADKFFSKRDEGLMLQWFGNVWLNPPFSHVSDWATKLENEYHWGNIQQALFLCKSALGYIWYEDLWIKYPACMLRDCVRFINAPAKSPQATTIMYLPPLQGYDEQVKKFSATFSQYGRIILP